MAYSSGCKVLKESLKDDNSISGVEMPEKVSGKAWIIWAAAVSFYLYEYVLRVSPSVMTDSLMLHFGVNATALGVLTSFYYYEILNHKTHKFSGFILFKRMSLRISFYL